MQFFAENCGIKGLRCAAIMFSDVSRKRGYAGGTVNSVDTLDLISILRALPRYICGYGDDFHGSVRLVKARKMDEEVVSPRTIVGLRRRFDGLMTAV